MTNDDGFRAPGIIQLASAVLQRGHRPVIAAPCKNMSGMSAALSVVRLDQRIDVEITQLDGIPGYGVDGPPALAVLAAHLGSFGHRPDAVLSGINAGLNTGASVLHSGTVGAALTAASFGYRALAVSIAEGDPWQFATAAAAAADGRLQLELRGRARTPPPPDSDTAQVARGYITATLLQSVAERSSKDLEMSAGVDADVAIRANEAPTNVGTAADRTSIDIPQLTAT
ncbi:MAG: 5'/3'-nucleotidase SurE [Actinobacteria bacterium]|nr:5'/3'-nucleotidase SurE [Actinomycetota bacterium]